MRGSSAIALASLFLPLLSILAEDSQDNGMGLASLPGLLPTTARHEKALSTHIRRIAFWLANLLKNLTVQHDIYEEDPAAHHLFVI